MPLQIDTENLRNLLEDFFVLTGIRMVLFDDAEQEILSYPERRIPFCHAMREEPEFLRLCRACDESAFRRCRAQGKLTVYRCHAGLTEAAAPLFEEGKIIGYLMFGQVGCGSSRRALTRELTAVCESFHCPPPPRIHTVPIRTERQIRACSKILEACTGYIRLQSLAVSPRDELLRRLEEYVCAHLGEDCSVEAIGRALSVSRSTLYRLFPDGGGGIASFVRDKRLEEACRLLQTTDCSSGEIAHRVGFSDEQYFRRLFRRRKGMSVREARKKR